MKFLSKVLLSAALALFAAGPSYAAPDYPKRQITIIVPYLAGGMVELFTRPVADAMSKELGVPVVVQVAPGGGGSIGATKVAKAKPDGYTLIMQSSVTCTYHPVTKNVSYDENSFVPLVSMCQSTGCLIVDPNNKNFNNMDELMAWCKAHPKELTVGCTGLTSMHKAMSIELKKKYDCDVQLVPYDGALGVTNAVVSGHLMAGFSEYLQNSQIKPVAYFTTKTPDFKIPDFGDLGMKKGDSMFVFYAPKGTPEAIQAKLDDVLKRACVCPDALNILKSFNLASRVIDKDAIIKMQDEQRQMVKDLVAAGEIPTERK